MDSINSELLENWANPSSSYRLGRSAKKALDGARGYVASFINAQFDQVVFTSGATEAINSAISSAIQSAPSKKHIITSCVEHSATLAYCEYLESAHGYEITRLPVSLDGLINLDQLNAAFRKDTAVVSLIWANNETGVVWPMSEIVKLCKMLKIPLHVDAVQAVGKMAVDFHSLGADFLSLSGHKIGAVKGSGALIVREPDSFVPMLYGGRQERGLRGGTECLPLFVALGEAFRTCSEHYLSRWEEIRNLRDAFEAKIVSLIAGASIHGKNSPRLPNTTSLHLPGIDSDAAVTYLDQKGICVSSGSACLESAITPSHVIYAMTQSHEIASETLRISLGLNTKEEELNKLISNLLDLRDVYS